jgi:hypothetical protein
LSIAEMLSRLVKADNTVDLIWIRVRNAVFCIPGHQAAQEQAATGVRLKDVITRFVLTAVAIGLAITGLVYADDNVREVQTKLSDEGFYRGEIDGAYSSDLATALTRYQVRNGLPITGQLDTETAKALDAKPAVGPPTGNDQTQSSETWRRLRKQERRAATSPRRSDIAATDAQEKSSPSTDEAAETNTETRVRSARATTAKTSSETTEPASAPPATTRTLRETTEPASAPPATARTLRETTEPVSAPPATARTSRETTEPAGSIPATGSESMRPVPAPPVTTSTDEFSTERLRDYVAAFVLAGLDRNVGAETEFFADRVKYYDQGVLDREKIRNNLQNYAERWPQRRFWFAGNITIEPPQLIIIIGVPEHRKRVRVTFPLRYELRNGATYSSGTVNKTLVLEPVGDDLQIVAVSERKA